MATSNIQQTVTEITNSATDRVLTVNNVSDEQQDLNAEANLTFASSTLTVNGDQTSSASAGGALRLSANDGAAMGDSHRLGVIEFTGAEDTSNTQVVGARIEALTDAAWTNAENGCALYFYTTDGNASQTNVLKIDSNQKATFSGEVEAASLDISGDADIDGTLEADAITVDGTALSEYIADTVGAMVGSNTETGIAVTYEDGDNTLDFAIAGTQTAFTSITNASLVVGRDADNQIKFSTDDQIIFRVAGADGVTMKASGEIEATSIDISGDADIDGTLEADAITLNGTALGSLYSPIAGSGSIVTTGALDSGSITSGFGSIAIGSDNISCGDLTASGGDIVLGSSGDADNTTLSAVGEAGTNTAGKSLTIKGGASTGNAAGGSIILQTSPVGSSGSSANSLVTAVTIDSTKTATFAGIVDITDATDASDATGDTGALRCEGGASIAKKLYVGTDADIDGTLEADAITVDGVALNEYIADTVGAMVGSNTETGISVTYEDGDNTLDFVLDAVGTNAISDNAVTLAKMAGIARGKIIYGDSNGDPAVLAAGTNNQVLTSDGTDISWQDAAGGGGGAAADDANTILHMQVFA